MKGEIQIYSHCSTAAELTPCDRKVGGLNATW